MGVSKRMVRVDEALRRELGVLCEKLVAPRLQALVTITKVECAPDLREATVFVSVLGDQEARSQALRVMLGVRRELQQELGRRVILKYTPKLRFREDRTAEQADRVLTILNELHLPDEPPAPAADTTADEHE
jgi:ribosome-binding factor A